MKPKKEPQKEPKLMHPPMPANRQGNPGATFPLNCEEMLDVVAPILHHLPLPEMTALVVGGGNNVEGRIVQERPVKTKRLPSTFPFTLGISGSNGYAGTKWKPLTSLLS